MTIKCLVFANRLCYGVQNFWSVKCNDNDRYHAFHSDSCLYNLPTLWFNLILDAVYFKSYIRLPLSRLKKEEFRITLSDSTMSHCYLQLCILHSSILVLFLTLFISYDSSWYSSNRCLYRQSQNAFQIAL